MLITKELAEKFKTNTLYNSIKITFPTNSDLTDINASNIVLDSFELDQGIISGDEFKFGGCISTEMKISLIDCDCSEFVGEVVQVYVITNYLNDALYPSDELFPSESLILPSESLTAETPIFYGKIESANKNTKNRNITEVTAYDAFYESSKKDITTWFAGNENGFGFAHYQKDDNFEALRDVLIEKLQDYAVKNPIGIKKSGVDIDSIEMGFVDEYVESVISEISLIDLLSAYCELNLSLAYISGLGNIIFVNLYDATVEETITSYKDLSFEEYTVEPIRMLSVKYADQKVFKKGSSNDYSWYVQDNILMRCRSTAGDISALYNSTNFFGSVYQYRPTEINLYSYWWIEVGDKIEIQTPYDDIGTITTFVFNKKMNGFITTLTSEGDKKLGNESEDYSDE